MYVLNGKYTVMIPHNIHCDKLLCRQKSNMAASSETNHKNIMYLGGLFLLFDNLTVDQMQGVRINRENNDVAIINRMTVYCIVSFLQR